MEISLVPSQFLSVVLEETKRNRSAVSSSTVIPSFLPTVPPKNEINCDDRFKTDLNKEPLKRKHSISGVLSRANRLSEQEKRDLTARLPKALLAECTVEIHTAAPRERRVVRPRFDARVSPIYSKQPNERAKLLNNLSIQGLQITPEPPLNLSVSNSRPSLNKLLSNSSSCFSKDYRLKQNTEDTDYTPNNAQDALQLIEVVYSDQDDDEDSKDGSHTSKPSTGARKASRPVPNLIEVGALTRANLKGFQDARHYREPSLTSVYDALASNLESVPAYDALANVPRSLLMANGLTSAKADQKLSFKCEHCPNVYPNRGALWQHSVATHSVEKTCQCKICGRKFYRNCSLALHLKSHSEEEYCTCKECGKSFTRLINLERHMKVHSESSDRYQCDHCDKSFPDRANLLRHSVCHGASSTQSRTHQCDTCGKSYKSKDHLEIHWQATHAAILCSICSKSFTSYPELALHEEAFHPDRPGQRYVCEHCGKAYSQKAVLRKHMISHTGERLRCTTCGIEFTQRSSLLRHVKRMHAGGQDNKNNGGALGYGLETLAANENLSKLFELDIRKASSLRGTVNQKDFNQQKTDKSLSVLIESLNSAGQTNSTRRPISVNDLKGINSKPVPMELFERLNRVGNTQNENEQLSVLRSLINSNALWQQFDTSNQLMKSLLEQELLNSSSNSMHSMGFLQQLESSTNAPSPLTASLNFNRNAFLTNPLLAATSNIAFAGLFGAYGTTKEAVPSDQPSVSEMEGDSVEESLEENECDMDAGEEDFSEETEDEVDDAKENEEETLHEFSYHGDTGAGIALEGNNYDADINDNDDSDDDNFIIDEDAREEDGCGSNTMVVADDRNSEYQKNGFNRYESDLEITAPEIVDENNESDVESIEDQDIPEDPSSISLNILKNGNEDHDIEENGEESSHVGK